MSTAPDSPGPMATARSAAKRTSGHDGRQAAARLGLIARGVVYAIVGVLAFKLAVGSGGKTESQTGALHTVAHQPLGEVLLIVLAVGLAAYAIWRLIEGL